MTLSHTFVRALFLMLSILFMLTYTLSSTPHATLATWLTGSLLGVGLALLLFTLDQTFKRFNLRTFNTTILGLFFGYLMALALLTLFHSVVAFIPLRPEIVTPVRLFLLLFATFLGVMMTLRAADELSLCLPFIKFSTATHKERGLLVDPSVLTDGRIVALASLGLVDERLIIPRVTLNKEAGEMLKKLKALPHLKLRYHDDTFPEITDTCEKMLRLCQLLDADLLTADDGHPQLDNIRVINLHALSNALRPLKQRGEMLTVKVQRHGKEEGQGVGYLDDGAMVVINGGGPHIGKTILTHVLSVKHTCSGRMIFCNHTESHE